MNLGLDQLPTECDVLVVGAGPAGSAAAATLARGGLDVVLVDAQAFPRDKVCGDGLIPDAHHALRRLGVLDEVMRAAQPAGHVGCIGPRGGRIDVPGELAVLPRKELDLIVCRAAVASGARMAAPVRFVAPLEDAAGTIVGARLQHGETTRELRAGWTLLATGAVPQALIAAGMATRQTPSGVALRGYVKNDAMVGRITALEIVWHRALTPGYGWIFPCGDGVYNIGVGDADSHGTRQEGGRLVKREGNLKEVMAAFLRVYRPARELVEGGTLLGAMKGAPLRCTLAGARLSRPGLLVIGEAAGSTYSFTGEGIGKALETGLLAADAVLTGHDPAADAVPASPDAAAAAAADAALPGRGPVLAAAHDASVRARYEAGIEALRPRFELYQRANVVNRHPWLADLLIWRAQKSARIVRRMSGVLNETSNPGNLVSPKGILRLFLDRG